MSERKCISKHRGNSDQYKQNLGSKISLRNKKIRFMIPIPIECKICLFKILKGKKINAIKEKILNKRYKGINFLRFYFHCVKCMSGLSIVTDLKELKYKPEVNCL